MKENEAQGRSNPSAGVHVQPDGPTVVFLTVKTFKKQPWLADGIAHRLIRETWLETKAWLVSDYVLMPDHLHLFCILGELDVEIETWIKYWKREFHLKHSNEGWKFQSRGWHHRLRADESYAEKWQYMLENPVRKGLVREPTDYPYRGKVFDLQC